MLEIIPPKLDFYVNLGDTLQGPAKQKGSSYELLTNDLAEQTTIAEAILRPIVDRVEDHPDGEGKAFWMTRGTGWHEGEYGTQVEMLAKSMGAHKFESGEYTGDILDLNVDGLICNFSHHASVFMVYFSTPMERELKFYAEGEEQIVAEIDEIDEKVRPDLVVRAHGHQHIAVERLNKVAIRVPGWMLAGRYPLRTSPARAWSDIGFTLVWLEPEQKKKGRRSIWHETIRWPPPLRRAIKLR
jgi:hypothetical protein